MSSPADELLDDIHIKGELDVRTINTLSKHQLRTVRDLTRLTESELSQLRGIGRAAFDQIVTVLRTRGLTFSTRSSRARRRRAGHDHTVVCPNCKQVVFVHDG